jgi:hypothetical protein
VSKNTIDGNFAGTNRSVIEITGFPIVSFSGNEIRNNENWLPDTFIGKNPIFKLQTDKSVPKTFATAAECEQRAKSIITIRGTSNLTLKDEIYEKNSIIDDYNPLIVDKSQAIESL